MKQIVLITFLSLLSWKSFSQNGHSLIFPETPGWNMLKENDALSFRLATTSTEPAKFSIQGTENSGITFDSLGNFYWKPSYDFTDRVAKTKEITVIFEAYWPNNKRERQPITFTITHVNRPPVVEDLPVFYVKQSTTNTYQIPSEYVYDQDGDPLVFKSIQSQMPEGSTLSAMGQLTWNPSRSQFAALKNTPLFVEFIVQDQPDKAETKGKLKIAQTQQDLPSEIMIVPGDSMFTIKEDGTLNLKIYISDPNGDDNTRNVGFISSDPRVGVSSFKENTQLQYEFIWVPGYEFTDDIKKTSTVTLTFFAIDKSNNRTERRIRVQVQDAENMIKKDMHLFEKYRSNLVESLLLIQQLDANQKKLNQEYKRARKGKKNRSILNASLGATTGLTPLILDGQPDQSKIVSGVGGTTVLTLGTLEATEVIGRSKDRIMDQIKSSIDIRTKIQSAGDDFARKYALKSSRRNTEFDKDIEKLRAVLNDQRIVLLELDSYARNPNKIDDKEIKKVFVDYAEEGK